MSETEDRSWDYIGESSVLTGVWSDRTRVHRGRGEFTIDFGRDLPEEAGPILVARAIVAPHVALDLRDQLDRAWQDYNRWSMPGESS